MFSQRGRSGKLWRVFDEPPPRNAAIRVTFGDATFELEPTDVAPEDAVDVASEDDPRMPRTIEPGTSVVFQPFVMAPLPS